MQITKTHKIIISIVIIAILLTIYINFDRKYRNQQYTSDTQTTTTESVSTTTNNGSIQVSSEGKGYTITQVPLDENITSQPVPDLNRPLTLFAGAVISPEAKTRATEKIRALQEQLKKDSTDTNNWSDLAMYQKMGGDYWGAVISWQYASKLAPKGFVYFGNLGNLYAYFIRDNIKAESYYKQAISKGPKHSYLYAQLAEVYRDLFLDNNKARAIVEQGLSQIPNDPVLLQFQASLK